MMFLSNLVTIIFICSVIFNLILFLKKLNKMQSNWDTVFYIGVPVTQIHLSILEFFVAFLFAGTKFSSFLLTWSMTSFYALIIVVTIYSIIKVLKYTYHHLKEPK